MGWHLYQAVTLHAPEDLTHREIHILGVLAAAADEETRIFRPAPEDNADLQRRCRTSVRQVYATMERLVKKGALEKVQRGQKYRRAAYRIPGYAAEHVPVDELEQARRDRQPVQKPQAETGNDTRAERPQGAVSGQADQVAQARPPIQPPLMNALPGGADSAPTDASPPPEPETPQDPPPDPYQQAWTEVLDACGNLRAEVAAGRTGLGKPLRAAVDTGWTPDQIADAVRSRPLRSGSACQLLAKRLWDLSHDSPRPARKEPPRRRVPERPADAVHPGEEFFAGIRDRLRRHEAV